jgi:hypothetical protein
VGRQKVIRVQVAPGVRCSSTSNGQYPSNVARAAQARTVPPPSDEMPDIARLQGIVAQFGGEILV